MPVLGKTKKDVLSEFRRNELLIAARAIFSKKGFHEATIDEIAESAEVAKGTVYLYYKSKRDLYLEALRHGIESMNHELNIKAAELGPCREKLRILTATKMEFFEENREFFNIYYSELGKLPSHPAGLDLVKDLYFAQAKIFAGLLQEGMRRREIRKVNVEKAAFAIADLTRDVTTQRFLGFSKTTIANDIDFVVDFIWKGISR
jgi:TetR/AcrR family fatty acid metabolism transcriptional regulator